MKKNYFILFLFYSFTLVILSALATLLFYRLFPEKTSLFWLVIAGFGLLLGVLSYLPFKKWTDQE